MWREGADGVVGKDIPRLLYVRLLGIIPIQSFNNECTYMVDISFAIYDRRIDKRISVTTGRHGVVALCVLSYLQTLIEKKIRFDHVTI